MNKKDLKLITEFCNKTYNFNEKQIILFFENEEQKDLISFQENQNLTLLIEYVKENYSIDLSKKKKELFPETNITIIIRSEDGLNFSNLVNLPYLKNENSDLIVEKYLIENSINFSIYQLNSLINNISKEDHTINIFYHVFTNDTQYLSSIKEIEQFQIKDKEKKIWHSYFNSIMFQKNTNMKDSVVIENILRKLND